MAEWRTCNRNGATSENVSGCARRQVRHGWRTWADLADRGGTTSATVNRGADVDARIAANAQADLAGNALVDATSQNAATATANGGGGIGVHVSALLPTATVA